MVHARKERNIKLLFLILSISAFFSLITDKAQAEVGQPSIGTNIAGATPYSGDLCYVDRMKQSTVWAGNTEPIELDTNSYPLEVATSGQRVSKILFQNMNGVQPAGDYTLSWSGTGSIDMSWDGSGGWMPMGYGTDITTTVTLPANAGTVQLKLTSSLASDHIKDINFVMPGFENTYRTHPIHPDYIDGLREFAFIRVMDPMAINRDYVSGIEWEDRVQHLHSTYREYGPPWEMMFYIANQIDRDIWINIPHKASDGYVRGLISLINTTLEPDRHIYVEYSNEVWNSIFPQYPYARDQGRAVFGAETGAADAVAWWNARRSGEIWQIFADNLTGDRTITRVAAGQGVNSYRAQQVLQALEDPVKNPTNQRADAVAIAYYFGAGVIDTWLTENDTIPRANITTLDVEDMMNHLDELLDLGEASIYGTREQGMIDHAALAANHGVRVVGYEGGQSYYIGTGYHELVKAATTPITEALSNHPRMRDSYNQFLTVFFENGGKEFSNFSYINAPQSSGAWGIYDYSGDTEGLYKLEGLRDMMNYLDQSNYRADVDGSSFITTTDALLTLRNSLGLSMNGTAWQTSSTTGDVNCDGVSNSTDALLILRYSLGLSMSGTGWCEGN